MPLREPLFLRETDHGVIAQECTNKGRALLIDFDMDYEKKYKEALERAEDFKNGIVQFALDPGESIVHYIFPELRESEDERIRKEIIDFLETIPISELKRVPRPICKWFFWLEKQKEQPISAEEVLARAGLKPYKDGNQWCILAGDNIQEGICGFGDTIDEALYQFLMEVLEKHKEQKPAEWSEGDKKMLTLTIERFDRLKYHGISCREIEESISWLKSLRPSWKPSEEDKEMKLKILKYLSTRCSVEQFEEVEEWLNNKLK